MALSDALAEGIDEISSYFEEPYGYTEAVIEDARTICDLMDNLRARLDTPPAGSLPEDIEDGRSGEWRRRELAWIGVWR